MFRAVQTAAIAGVMMLVLTACGSGDRAVMPDVVGKQLDVAKSDIERAGFMGDVEITGGGLFGVVDDSNWMVCEQEPGAGVKMANPRLVVDRECGAEDQSTDPAPTPSPSASSPAIITSADNAEFAALLALTDYCSPDIAAFAAAHVGERVEFDGFIGAMNNHDGASTRYDMLLNAGDFDPDHSTGPMFQYRDVNASNDLHWTGAQPDTVGVGANLHLVAEIDKYEESSCLFLLDPVQTSAR